MNVALRTAVSLVLLFAYPIVVHADASSLVWGDVVMRDGGTYAVPLNVVRQVFMESDAAAFGVEGILFRIPDPGGGTREFVAHLGGYFAEDNLAWEEAGVYELDVYWLDPPQQGLTWPQRIYAFVFGTVAHAQSADHFLETIRFAIEDAAASEPDPVIIIPGILGSEQHNGEWVIDPILHIYDDLIATLDANGYTPGVDLFPFPYNWRKSNIETALLLKEKIDEVKGICGCAKVDLVAHSMGGLVARQYIQSDAYKGDVDQLIFLGTPHLGAPKAYSIWEAGEYSPGLLPIEDSLLEIMLKHEAAENQYPSLFAYVRTVPIDSVRQLLPVYDYVFDGSELRDYPNNYPTNTFLEDLNANVSNLLNSGVEIHNFVGETQTQQTIVGIDSTDPSPYLPKWIHGYPKDFYDLLGNHGLIRGQGDETVPTASASFVNSDLRTTSFAHTEIPSGAEGEIYQILTGNNASILIDNLDIPNAKIILIKILSPADLLVIAPDGSKIGKDFDTGLEVNDIPNAFYTGFTTDTEFITILNPLDGEYQIFNQGTGSGGYGVEVAYVSEEDTVETSFTGNTTSGLITELDVPVDNENPEALEIFPADTEPPVITIAAPVAKDYVHSEQLPVNVSAVDGGSGVYALETFLDGTPVPNAGSVDLFFKSLGVHTLLASSTDNVGNAATSTRTFRVIATIDSTLSDIERAYKLGWMSKKVYRDIKDDFKDAIKTKKGKKVVDKDDAKDILKELKKYRGKGLNEQGYQLLKADIEWLINSK